MKFSRIIIFCFISFTIFSHSFAQNTDYSAFGAPVVKFTSLLNQNSIILGGRFGWMIDKSIVLGGGIYALSSNVKTRIIDPVSKQDALLGLTYGGLEFEYVLLADEPIHASIDMLFAGGGVTYQVPDKNVSHTSYFSQNLLVWEPQVNLEFKVVDWLHLDAGLSYRMISSYDSYYGVSKNDLKGMNGVLTFKFGKY